MPKWRTLDDRKNSTLYPGARFFMIRAALFTRLANGINLLLPSRRSQYIFGGFLGACVLFGIGMIEDFAPAQLSLMAVAGIPAGALITAAIHRLGRAE
ncbi:hypothetical protein [Streptomyces sp. S1]|uniref:hypothetical protein n=1 Tax=Streptomyces sp. S1 TaxID=718288 RepID=UPI003D765E36